MGRATLFGLATAGVARWAGPKIANARVARAQAKGAPPPSGPFDVPPDLDANPEAVYGATRDNRSANILVGLDRPGAQAPMAGAGAGASAALAEPADE